MQASTVVGAIALLLAVVAAAGYAYSDESPVAVPERVTMQKKIDQREAQRRAAVAEQQKRKEAFERRCSKPVKTAEELAECRAVYRQM
jgi:hypothetical protein